MSRKETIFVLFCVRDSLNGICHDQHSDLRTLKLEVETGSGEAIVIMLLLLLPMLTSYSRLKLLNYARYKLCSRGEKKEYV